LTDGEWDLKKASNFPHYCFEFCHCYFPFLNLSDH
jgi:hypothetical protein